MPEGDTIHKLATALHARLQGRTLRSTLVPACPRPPLAGRRVEAVRARGKHMFVELEGNLVLRSHLGMHGTWHRYGPGEPWQKPERHASIVLGTDADVFVCFHAKEVELFEASRMTAFDVRRPLGPDLAVAAPSADVLERRVRSFTDPADPLVDVLLDQRIASGIGNVYKSELLFLERLHPLAPVAVAGTAALERLYARAHELLRANSGPGPRVTRGFASLGDLDIDPRSTRDSAPGERLWVYRRKLLPCFRCASPITSARLGRGLRSTYWCPRCQAP